MDTPILLCVYRRLEKVIAVLESLKAVQPTHLYISANAPKNEAEKVYTDAIKEAIDKHVTWKCRIHKKYENEHIASCSTSITKGIDWFFSNVESGIILEDDCVADPSFFEMCTVLLEKYRNDETVYHISGTNTCYDHDHEPQLLSSNFSMPNWGWATWRRCWEKYTPQMNNWETIKHKIHSKVKDTAFWDEFLAFNAETKIAWDIQWNVDIWANGGIVLLPSYNTVSNIGFGKLATLTTNEKNLGANLPLKRFELRNNSPIPANDAALEQNIIHFIRHITRPAN